MDSYRHQPLAGARSIRLLKLLPQRHDRRLRVELVETPLDDSVAYEALSYVWGEDAQSPRRRIFCEDKTLPVTENCRAALLQLRTPETRILWIDAICTDQTSLAERNHQVRLMGEIYSRAWRVLIWLGKGSADSDLALEYLSQFAQQANPRSFQFETALASQLQAMHCTLFSNYERLVERC